MYKRLLKPVFDFVIAFSLLILLFPFLVLIVVILILYFKGSPFFFQKRIGLNEKPFTIWKFRTMSNKRNENNELLSDEFRITKLGKILRKTGIDEFPQLINILKGDMSFVGPRPLLPDYLPLYSLEVKKRHSVKPGLTGLAQIHGGNSLEWEKRFEQDLQYIKNLSFHTDLLIIKNTINPYLTRTDSNNIGRYNPQKKS
ncbi:MAG: sugar transferase [Opitutaceae bacterium]|nr:sugar transferase [Cytophagales bacterium]